MLCVCHLGRLDDPKDLLPLLFFCIFPWVALLREYPHHWNASDQVGVQQQCDHTILPYLLRVPNTSLSAASDQMRKRGPLVKFLQLATPR